MTDGFLPKHQMKVLLSGRKARHLQSDEGPALGAQGAPSPCEVYIGQSS
jgi:hypothetical protein